MNRRKKVVQILNSRAKKAHGKTVPKNKPKYISKADRAKLEAEANQEADAVSDGPSEAAPE